MLSHAISYAMELFWAKYVAGNSQKSKICEILYRIPMVNLVYIVGGGYMFHTRTFYPWLAPTFLKRLMDLITDYKWVSIAPQTDDSITHLFSRRN